MAMFVAGVILLGGLSGTLMNSITAHAATTATATATTNSASSVTPPVRDESKGGHVANGITETLLTGDTATKVKAAALAAEPGGTILRVENDAEGATYEAHMTKADGSRITVKMDANFKVTSTEAGPGGMRHGEPPQQNR